MTDQVLINGTKAIAYLGVSRAVFYRFVKNGVVTPINLPGLSTPRYSVQQLNNLAGVDSSEARISYRADLDGVRSRQMEER